MRPLLGFLTLAFLSPWLQAQNPGMQAAQTAQMASQTSAQAAQQANQQAMQDAQLASQNAQVAQQQATQNSSNPRCVAPTPIFSVKAGTFSSPVTLEIRAHRGRKIYYTTDGWTPTIDSTAYTGPITIDTSTTLQAVAISQCGNRSRVASATYTLKGIPPASPSTVPASVTSNAAAALLSSGKLLLARGTAVPLVFASDVTSKTAHIGDKISLTVAEDLKSGDVVAVRKGTPSTAVITEVDRPRALGMPGEIYFQADSLQADGTTVRLKGRAAKEGADKTAKASRLMMTPVPIGLGVHGGDAEIKQGTPFTAFVEMDTVLPASSNAN